MGVKGTVTVALAGNPNVGKSTLFNRLTGLRQHTGNWPGKTVEVATGRFFHRDKQFELVDLPGTYALSGGSEDEKIAAAFISEGSTDWTVVVCDGVALERSLILALQIREMTPNMVLCVNLMDEAQRMGLSINGQRLSDILGVPVVLMSANRNKGIEELLDILSQPTEGKNVPKNGCGNVICMAERIASACVTRTGETPAWRQKVDRILVSRSMGVPILLGILFFVVWITVWGANIPSELLQTLMDVGYDGLQKVFYCAPAWLRGLLLDGAYTTAARVLSVMLPPMAIFFPLFTLLEDIGYLPRMAFLLDGGMSRCGGCGKQALTMCMGLGCNAVGVTGCRIIESPRERLLAILTNAMIPCNGRFPTLILLAQLLLPGPGAAFLVAGFVMLGALGAMLTSGVLSKTALKHKESLFLMEIPSLRRPRVFQVLIRSLLDRTVKIALRAMAVAAPAGMLLWILGRGGLLGQLAAALEPLALVLGMNGAILLGFFLSLPANELLIPVCLMVMTGTASLQGLGDPAAMLKILTTENILCTMMFTLFHWPCATTIITVFKETKSYKKTAAAIFLPTAVGCFVCLCLHFLFQYLGG